MREPSMNVGSDLEDQVPEGSQCSSAPSDPVPAEVSDFAKAALGYRREGFDFADLVDDSLEVLNAPARASRRLRFRAPDVIIELDVEAGRHGAHTARRARSGGGSGDSRGATKRRITEHDD